MTVRQRPCPTCVHVLLWQDDGDVHGALTAFLVVTCDTVTCDMSCHRVRCHKVMFVAATTWENLTVVHRSLISA